EAPRLTVHDLKGALAERLARTWHDNENNEIADASHTVVELVQAGKLEVAEAAARDLLMRYPHAPGLGLPRHRARAPRRKPPGRRLFSEIARHHAPTSRRLRSKLRSQVCRADRQARSAGCALNAIAKRTSSASGNLLTPWRLRRDSARQSDSRDATMPREWKRGLMEKAIKQSGSRSSFP